MREKRDVKKRCFLTYYMMAKTKIQPILPSLRERKRYLAFEIISKDKITDFNKIEEAISSASLQLFGEIGNAKAGMLFLKNKYDQTKQRGLIRVNNKEIDNIRSALTLVKKIDNKEVIIRSIGVSGILKKAINKYLAS